MKHRDRHRRRFGTMGSREQRIGSGGRLLPGIQHNHGIEWPVVVDANEEAAITSEAGEVLPAAVSNILTGRQPRQTEKRKRRHVYRLCGRCSHRRQWNGFESVSVALQSLT